MKRFTRIHTIALTLLLLLGSIPAAAAGDRPFALNGLGVSTFITDSAGNIIGANATGSGTATHLGRWTVNGGVVTFTPGNGGLQSHGEATITAANGDTLNMILDGALNLNTFTDQGVIQFGGGTGRFAGASGTGAYVVTVDPATNGFELTVVARINY